MENFKLTRDPILNILNEISIKIPRHTKLKTDRLRHRLERCLDATQRYRNLFGNEDTVVNPASYPIWEDQSTIAKGLDRKILGGIDLGINPGTFSRMCRLIVALGEQLSKGVHEVVLTDQEASAIAIKIHEVRHVGENRPLLVVGFATIASTRKMGIKRAMKSFYAADKQPQALMVHASSEEQALLFHLLKQNQSRLDPEFAKEISDSRYTASFLLPISWLTMEDLGRLGRTTGCVVCGEPTKCECDRCQSVQYCGKDCQRKHWDEHEYICHALSSGTWHTVTLDPSPNAELQPGSLYRTTTNRYDDLNDKPTFEKMSNGAPPNTYGSKCYLVKLQIPVYTSDCSSYIFVYDKRKSFQLFLRQDLNSGIYDEAIRAFGNWPKMYRWAQRVGDREWRICFDREPGIEPQW